LLTHFAGLVFAEKVFRQTDNLSHALQSVRLSASEGRDMALLTVDSSLALRSEDEANALYDRVKEMATELGE
jgi:hypothetical protein